MSDLKLYTYPNNPRALKVLVASKYSSSPVQLPPFHFGSTNAEPDFLALFPSGRVPALKISPDEGIGDASAIAVFLAGDKLYHGCGDVDRAKILQWMFYSEADLWPVICRLSFPIMGIDIAGARDDAAKYRSQLEKELTSLSEWLKFRTYLVTERITLADIAVFSTLHMLFSLDQTAVKMPQCVERWFNTVKNQKEVKEALEELGFKRGSQDVVPIGGTVPG